MTRLTGSIVAEQPVFVCLRPPASLSYPHMSTRLDQIDPDAATMSFGDHLEELRRRVILALIIPLPLAIATYFVSGGLLRWICAPLRSALRRHGLPESLQVLGPAEALMTQIKISIIAALILSAPWVFWQAWLFVRPGLYRHERRFVYFLIPGSAILTTAGVSVFYWLFLPLVLTVLVSFGSVLDDEMSFEALKEQAVAAAPEEPLPPAMNLPILATPPREMKPGDVWLTPDHELMIVVPRDRGMDPAHAPKDANGDPLPVPLEVRRIPLVRSTAISQEFRLTSYVNFVLLLMLGMVLAFQTPLVMLLLGWLDILRPDTLRRNRKYALFWSAVLGAVLTPADPWSMLAMMIPLYVLFELGLVMMTVFPASRIAGKPVAK